MVIKNNKSLMKFIFVVKEKKAFDIRTCLLTSIVCTDYEMSINN